MAAYLFKMYENINFSYDTKVIAKIFGLPAQKTKPIEICKGCGLKNTLVEDYHTNIVVCLECGMVNEEMIYQSI